MPHVTAYHKIPTWNKYLYLSQILESATFRQESKLIAQHTFRIWNIQYQNDNLQTIKPDACSTCVSNFGIF